MLKRKLKVPEDTAALIRNLHPEIKRRLKEGLAEIMENPECGKALKNELEGLMSLRVGRFRLIYRKRGEIIEVIALGPRKTIYEETYRLLKRG